MKRVLYEIAKTFFLFLLMFAVSTGGILVYRSELAFVDWKKRVESVDHAEAVNMQILRANEYNQEVMGAVKMLAVENGLLCEREAKTTKYVTALDEENSRLRGALAEAVARLEAQQEELNEAYDNMYLLEYRIEVLERALSMIPTPADPATEPDIMNILDIIDAIDTSITVLSIIL